jgi:hypothetical protein
VPRVLGFVHHSIAILYHEAPNPNLTIRHFCLGCRAPRSRGSLRASLVHSLGAQAGSASLVSVMLAAADSDALLRAVPALDAAAQVRFCRYRFSSTGELGYRGTRGAVGLGYRSTV